MSKLVFGVGVYEKGTYQGSIGGKNTKEYTHWTDMLRRCYSEKYHARCPTYIGCSVSEGFCNFQKFTEWCNNQIGFGVKDYQLDKDIIYKGNKQYNRYSCAFVPREVNTLLRTSKASRGEYPLGVCFHKGKFYAYHRVHGSRTHIGIFSTPEEAFSAYKTAKEAHIKVVAEKYKDSIDPRVYQALMEWEVGEGD